MSEPRYREWILETIDSLRSRKARPDLERICRMVRRRHGSEPDRTRSELEKLIQEQAVLKVNYKGSVSYRNAAKVQRKCREKTELTTGATVKVQAKHASLENGTRAQSSATQSKAGGSTGKEAGQACQPKPSRTPVPPRKDATSISPISENRCISCGAEVCRNKACSSTESSSQKGSAAKDKLARARCCNGSNNEHGETMEKNGSNKKGGHREENASSGRDCYGANKTKTCGSANTRSKLGLKHKPSIKHRLRLRTKTRRANPNYVDLGDRLVASVRSLEERNRGSDASTGPSPLGLKEILGFLSSQGRLSQEKLTRSRVKMVLEREVAKGRLRRTRFGNIALPTQGAGAKLPARRPKSAAMERRITKRDEDKVAIPMETVSEDVGSEKKLVPASHLVPLSVDQCSQVDQARSEEPPCGAAVMTPTCESHHGNIQELELEDTLDIFPQGMLWNGVKFVGVVPISEEVRLPPAVHTCVKQEGSPGTEPPVGCQDACTGLQREADERKTELQARAVSLSGQREAVEGAHVEECALTPDQLASDATATQDLEMTSEDASQTSFTCTIDYKECKDDPDEASRMLTPANSPGYPGVAEKVGMNGEVDQKLPPDPSHWTVEDVVCYFSAAGFPEQASAFGLQEIDGKSLLLMQRSDVLTGLSIKLGPALKIYEHHVKMLQRTHFEDDGNLC